MDKQCERISTALLYSLYLSQILAYEGDLRVGDERAGAAFTGRRRFRDPSRKHRRPRSSLQNRRQVQARVREFLNDLKI